MGLEYDIELAFDNLSSINNIIKDIEKLVPDKSITNSSDCEHIDTTEECGTITCYDCGQELGKNKSFEKEWRYYGSNDNNYGSDPSRCHYRQTVDKSIIKDIEHMGFPSQINIKSNSLFEFVTKGEIYRGKSRQAIIFASVFQAFKLNGTPKSLEYLQDKFGLKRKVISKGMNHFGVNANKSLKLEYKCISPNDLIPDILKKCKAGDKHIDNVMKLYKVISNRSSLLNRSKPQSISSGLVWYYCVYTKKTITMKELAKIVDLSEATIEKIAKEIDKIIGSKLFKNKKRGRIPKIK